MAAEIEPKATVPQILTIWIQIRSKQGRAVAGSGRNQHHPVVLELRLSAVKQTWTLKLRIVSKHRAC